MTTTQVDPKAVERLVATEAIRELLVRRGRAADGKSPEKIVAQHVPGSRDTHGIFDGTIEEFAEFLRTHNYSDPRYGIQRHTIANLLLNWRGRDMVEVESYHLAYHRLVIDGTGARRTRRRALPRRLHPTRRRVAAAQSSRRLRLVTLRSSNPPRTARHRALADARRRDRE